MNIESAEAEADEGFLFGNQTEDKKDKSPPRFSEDPDEEDIKDLKRKREPGPDLSESKRTKERKDEVKEAQAREREYEQVLKVKAAAIDSIVPKDVLEKLDALINSDVRFMIRKDIELPPKDNQESIAEGSLAAARATNRPLDLALRTIEANYLKYSAKDDNQEDEVSMADLTKWWKGVIRSKVPPKGNEEDEVPPKDNQEDEVPPHDTIRTLLRKLQDTPKDCEDEDCEDIIPIKNPEESFEKQGRKYAKIALDDYNENTSGPNYELVVPLMSNFICCTQYMLHVSFTSALPQGQSLILILVQLNTFLLKLPRNFAESLK